MSNFLRSESQMKFNTKSTSLKNESNPKTVLKKKEFKP